MEEVPAEEEASLRSFSGDVYAFRGTTAQKARNCAGSFSFIVTHGLDVKTATKNN